MHPGPMNRGVEIASDVADLPRAVITDQVTNGIAVRMSLLYLILGRRGLRVRARRRRRPRVPRRTLFRGARLVDPASGQDGAADVLVEDESIAEVGARSVRAAGRRRRSTRDGLVWPRASWTCTRTSASPGFEHKETIESGSRAAAAGGFTARLRDAEHRPGRRQRGRGRRGPRARARRRAAATCIPAAAITRGPGGRVAHRDGRAGRGRRPAVHRRRPLRRVVPRDAAARWSTRRSSTS